MTTIIVPAIELPCSVIQKTSAKTGNPYHMISVEVDDNYTLELFLSNEQAELLRTKLTKD